MGSQWQPNKPHCMGRRSQKKSSTARARETQFVGLSLPKWASRFPTPTLQKSRCLSPPSRADRLAAHQDRWQDTPWAHLPTRQPQSRPPCVQTAQLPCPRQPARSSLTLGINISHFTPEEFASHRPPWKQLSSPLGGSHTTLWARPGC